MKRGLLILFILSVFNSVFLSGINKYYRICELDGKYSYIGRYPITDAVAEKANCYLFSLNTQGRLEKIEYHSLGLLCENTDGLARVTFQYRSDFETRLFYNKNGKLLNKTRLKLDGKGNRTAKFEYDADDKPLHTDSQAFYQLWENDMAGNIKKVMFFDLFGNPVKFVNNVDYISFNYDATGLMIEKEFFSFSDNNHPTQNDKTGKDTKIGKVKLQYDTNKNVTELTFTSTEDNSSIKFVMIYDANGYCTETRSIGTYGQFQSYFGDNAVIKKEFDINGYLTYIKLIGVDENTLDSGFYYKIKHNADYSSADVSFWDINDNPVEISSNIGKYRFTYDISGRITDQRYFNLNNKPIAIKDNVSIIKRIYQNDLITEVSFYDTLEQPVNIYGYFAKRKFVYDDKGKLTEEVLIREKNKKNSILKNVDIARYKFDGRENVSEVNYYDIDNLPVNNALGISKIVISPSDTVATPIIFYNKDGKMLSQYELKQIIRLSNQNNQNYSDSYQDDYYDDDYDTDSAYQWENDDLRESFIASPVSKLQSFNAFYQTNLRNFVSITDPIVDVLNGIQSYYFKHLLYSNFFQEHDIAMPVDTTAVEPPVIDDYESALKSNLQNLASQVIQFYKTPVSQGGAGSNPANININEVANFIGFTGTAHEMIEDIGKYKLIRANKNEVVITGNLNIASEINIDTVTATISFPQCSISIK